MPSPSDDDLIRRLLAIMTGGFNRSIGALERAGAINAKKMRSDYKPGSDYYELVTEMMLEAAIPGARGIRELFEKDCSQ